MRGVRVRGITASSSSAHGASGHHRRQDRPPRGAEDAADGIYARRRGRRPWRYSRSARRKSGLIRFAGGLVKPHGVGATSPVSWSAVREVPEQTSSDTALRGRRDTGVTGAARHRRRRGPFQPSVGALQVRLAIRRSTDPRIARTPSPGPEAFSRPSCRATWRGRVDLGRPFPAGWPRNDGSPRRTCLAEVDRPQTCMDLGRARRQLPQRLVTRLRVGIPSLGQRAFRFSSALLERGRVRWLPRVGPSRARVKQGAHGEEAREDPAPDTQPHRLPKGRASRGGDLNVRLRRRHGYLDGTQNRILRPS